MNGHDLNEQFRALARAYPQQAGRQVERNLIAEFRRRHSRRVWLRAVPVGLGIAALFGLVFFWLTRSTPLILPAPEQTAVTRVLAPPARMPRPVAALGSQHQRRARNTNIVSGSFTGFIALPSAIGGVPLGSPYIARMKMSAAQLSFAGIPVMASDQRQQIETDALVESDGMIRAIRFVQ